MNALSSIEQGCQNPPTTGAIIGYFKVFDACKLLERSEENGLLKSCKKKTKKKLFSSWSTCSFLWSTLSTWETHIPKW